MSCKRKLSFCETVSSRTPLRDKTNGMYVLCKLPTLKKTCRLTIALGT
jgi:hypothetical protein